MSCSQPLNACGPTKNETPIRQCVHRSVEILLHYACRRLDLHKLRAHFVRVVLQLGPQKSKDVSASDLHSLG